MISVFLRFPVYLPISQHTHWHIRLIYMTLERLMFQSGQKPFTSAQNMAFCSPAEDDLFFKQAAQLLLISITGVMDKDTETKPEGVRRRRIHFKEFSVTQSLIKPKMVDPFGICDANLWQGPRRAVPVGIPWAACTVQESRQRDMGRQAAFTARAQRPHRGASFWLWLGSCLLLPMASVQGEVQDMHCVTRA